jgi:hypothetical protein
MFFKLGTQLIDSFAFQHFFGQGGDFACGGQVEVLRVDGDDFLVVSLLIGSGVTALNLIFLTSQFFDPCVEVLL